MKEQLQTPYKTETNKDNRTIDKEREKKRRCILKYQLGRPQHKAATEAIS